MTDAYYYGPMDPVHPCRILPTRHCPEEYDDVCGGRPCARYESDDEAPWLAEIAAESIIRRIRTTEP